MITFDAPGRETCIVRETRTNTPLQALDVLNDVTYVEAPARFAERMMSDVRADAASAARRGLSARDGAAGPARASWRSCSDGVRTTSSRSSVAIPTAAERIGQCRRIAARPDVSTPASWRPTRPWRN